MAGDTLLQAHPPRLGLGSSGRLSELFCCPINALRRCIETVAIAFERFLLHESDDFCLVTLLKEHPQLPL